MKEGNYVRCDECDKNKLCWECHTRDLRFKIQDNPETPFIKFQDTPDSECSKFNKKNPYGGWRVGGRFFQEILPLRGSILQAGTCQILSLAENPRWSRVWQ